MIVFTKKRTHKGMNMIRNELEEDKMIITAFALHQVTKRFWKDGFDIMNNSRDGRGVYNIIFKKPISDTLMSVFVDTLKKEFNFQKGRDKVVISCEVELFKGLDWW